MTMLEGRFAELADQAEVYSSMWIGNEKHEALLEKFAELIVRECMSYMKDGDIDFAKFMIKKHFGVEE